MKKILFIIIALFSFFLADAQSNVFLRGDSIIVMKQGGFAELVIRNSTKDSGVGYVLTNIGNGVSRWRPATGGGGGGGSQSWDQTLNVGHINNGKTLLFDTSHTIADGGSSAQQWIDIAPIYQDGAPHFYFNMGAQRYSGVTRADNVFNFGWNLNGGGGPVTAGEEGIGIQMEQNYIPVVGDTNTEMHGFYIDRAGTQHRIFSYTIKDYIKNYDFYQTISQMSLKRPDNDSVWYGATIGGFQYERFGDHGYWGMGGDATGVQLFRGGGSAVGDAVFMNAFSSGFMPFSLVLSDVDNHHSGSSITYTDSIGTLMTVSADRNIGGALFASPAASGLGMAFAPNNTTVAHLHTDRTNFSTSVAIDDNPSLAAQSQRFAVNTNGSWAVNMRLTNNTTAANTYGLQIVTAGAADEANAIWILGLNNGGASNNKLIHPAANTVDNATNWFIYSEATAASWLAGWLKIGGVDAIDRPRQALDVNGKARIDTVNTVSSTATNYMAWNASTHELEKRAILETTATLDFASTAANSVTDLTITLNGAVSGDLVELAVPNGSVPVGGTFFAWCTTDVVNVRFANNTGSSLDPSSGTFKVRIIR